MKKICLLIVSIFLFNTLCFAQIKTFTKQGESVVQKDQSVNQVISYLKQKLTREAQEEAGTFITTNLKIENYQITKDEFTSFAGSISKTTVLEETSFMKGKEQYVKVKIKADIDTDNVKAYLEKIIQDNEYKEQAQKAIKEAEELKKKNLELENKLKTSTKQEYEQKLSLQAEQQIQEQKQREIELNKMAVQAKEEYTKFKEEQLQLQQKREEEILKLKERIAKEKDTVAKQNLKNQAKIKELELKAKENQQKWNTNTNKISIQQAIQEATKVKQETAEIINKFETLIKENKEKITKSYDEQIQLSCNTNPKDQWETEEEYNTRLEKNKQIEENLERKKEDNVFYDEINTLISMVTTLEPFVKKLKYFQSEEFFDKEDVKAELLNIEEINVDKQYFTLNVKYENEAYILGYDFSKIGKEQAKLMCQTQNQFVIEPLFSMEYKNIYKDVLKSFIINGIEYKVEEVDIMDDNCDSIENISCENFSKKEKFFSIKFQYTNKQYNINFDFSKIQEKEAKKLYKHPKENKIIPNKYKKEVEGEIQKKLIGFNIKHLGTNNSISVSGENLNCFEEINTYEKYKYRLLFMDAVLNNDEYIIDRIKFLKKYKYAFLENIIKSLAKAYNKSKYYKLDNLIKFRNYLNDIGDVVVDVVAGTKFTAALKVDGTIDVVGEGFGKEAFLYHWIDIVSISNNSSNHTVGLKRDGTCVAVGDNKYGQCNVKKWKNIVDISAGSSHTVGLKKDGTCVAVGCNGITRINPKTFKMEIIYKKDSNPCDVQKWRDIIAIFASHDFTVGLKKDGTCVAVGDNEQGECNVQKWKDIIAISAGGAHTIGLKKDGTCVATGSNYYGQCNIKSWKNIVAIFADSCHTVGLKKDGSLVVAGSIDYDDDEIVPNIKDWKNIANFSFGSFHVVGIKNNGEIIATGSNVCGQCNIQDWNIPIPEFE